MSAQLRNRMTNCNQHIGISPVVSVHWAMKSVTSQMPCRHETAGLSAVPFGPPGRPGVGPQGLPRDGVTRTGQGGGHPQAGDKVLPRGARAEAVHCKILRGSGTCAVTKNGLKIPDLRHVAAADVTSEAYRTHPSTFFFEAGCEGSGVTSPGGC